MTESTPAAPDVESPSLVPAGPPTATTEPSVTVSGEAVTAALLADVEHARKPPRPAVWQALSSERARVMLEAAAPFIRADADAKLAALREHAAEWAARAPADDWGLTPADTVTADCGRAILTVIGTEEEARDA